MTRHEDITPAELYERWGDAEMAEHCRRQDRERAEFWKPHYQWRDANDKPTPEAQAYAALCLAQARVNEIMLLARNASLRVGTPLVGDQTKAEFERLKRGLGLRATEQERDDG